MKEATSSASMSTSSLKRLFMMRLGSPSGKAVNEYNELIQAQSKIPNSYSHEPTSLVYQYRSFDGFWAILKSDSLWATNARFSNDSEEQRFGMNVLERLSCANDDTLELDLDEKYIICFSSEDDALSQWRGYAPDGGCNIGFDLIDLPLKYTLPDIDASQPPHTDFAQLAPVFYLKPQKRFQEDKAYLSDCREQLQLDIAPDDKANDTRHTFRREIQRRAPYIKHKGFEEEREYRLVFENSENALDNCVRYRDAPDSGVKIPYIVVYQSDPQLSKRACVIRVGLEDPEAGKRLADRLRTELKGTKIQSCIADRQAAKDLTEPFCRGCSMRKWRKQFDPGELICRYKNPDQFEFTLTPNSVHISQGKNQELLYPTVHDCVTKFMREEAKYSDKKISIWCEGHLPIRSIKVGPCLNQADVAEAIRYYCKHTYWLRDVEISTSDIPFRKSL